MHTVVIIDKTASDVYLCMTYSTGKLGLFLCFTCVLDPAYVNSWLDSPS